MSSLFYDAFSTYSVFVLTYGTASLIGFALDYYSVYEDKKLKNRSRDEYIVLYKRCLPVVATNICIYSLPYIYISLLIQSLVWGNPEVYPDNIFSCLYYFMYYNVMTTLLTDMFFYCGHKLMHTKPLYKYHKLHHEIKYPISISALYMHPVDLYCSNLSPVALSALILNYNVFTLKMIIFMQLMFSILEAHGGYIKNAHTFHHKLFKYNYGLGFKKYNMDRLFKTDYIEMENIK